MQRVPQTPVPCARDGVGAGGGGSRSFTVSKTYATVARRPIASHFTGIICDNGDSSGADEDQPQHAVQPMIAYRSAAAAAAGDGEIPFVRAIDEHKSFINRRWRLLVRSCDQYPHASV